VVAGYPLFNSLGSYDVKTKEYKKYFAGPRKFVQECVFAPRSQDAPEGDGFVIALQNNYEEMCSELTIVDTKDMSKAVALVKLPVRLRAGLHGNWVDSSDADGHPASMPVPS
jgi:carotenoid cleavage dioxygenase-like enzyme